MSEFPKPGPYRDPQPAPRPDRITARDRWHHARQDRRTALAAAARVTTDKGSVLALAEQYVKWLGSEDEQERVVVRNAAGAVVASYPEVERDSWPKAEYDAGVREDGEVIWVMPKPGLHPSDLGTDYRTSHWRLDSTHPDVWVLWKDVVL